MTLIEQLIEEMEAARSRLVAPWEGYKDNARSLIGSDGQETITFVNEAVNLYARRESRLQNSLSALRSLQDDGYPADLHFTASAAVASVLGGQVDSQKAAFATITPVGEAANAEVSLGSVTPL